MSHAYGQLYYDDGTGFNEEVAASGTPQPIADSGLSVGKCKKVVGSAANGTLTVKEAGNWLVSFSLSGLGEASDAIQAMLQVNSVSNTRVKARMTFAAASMLLNSCAAQGIVALAKGDVLRVAIDSNASNDSLQVHSFQLTAVLLGKD